MSLDDDLRDALRSRDANSLPKILLRVPSDVLVSLLEQARADHGWSSKLEGMVLEAAPFCVCGKIATVNDETCQDHAGAREDYEAALRAYEGPGTQSWKKSKTNAIRLMKAAVTFGGAGVKDGTCYFPPCGKATDTDYDGGYYVWCDDHNKMFGGEVDIWRSLQKPRGEPVSRDHDYVAGLWERG